MSLIDDYELHNDRQKMYKREAARMINLLSRQEKRPLPSRDSHQSASTNTPTDQSLADNDFRNSRIYEEMKQPRHRNHPAIHVPVWCNWITRNTTQALLLGQINYWFGRTNDKSNAKNKLHRTLRRGNFASADETKEYRCLIASHRMLAQQCCLSPEQIRGALKRLADDRLIQSTPASESVSQLQAAHGTQSELIKSGVKCYRLDSGGIALALIKYLREMSEISEQQLVAPFSSDDSRLLTFKLKSLGANQNRIRSRTERSNDPDRYQSDVWASHESDVEKTGEPEMKQIPDHATEFVDSPLQQVLEKLETWVTVPHWVIRMVEGNINEAFVLSKIIEWQRYIKRQHAGYLWLEKTHEQLAGEIGMLTPGQPRNRYRRVTEALQRLAGNSLIQKHPPNRDRESRYTRIRLLSEEIERRWELIKTDEWWAPKEYSEWNN
jgi:hypothetical protein